MLGKNGVKRQNIQKWPPSVCITLKKFNSQIEHFFTEASTQIQLCYLEISVPKCSSILKNIFWGKWDFWDTQICLLSVLLYIEPRFKGSKVPLKYFVGDELPVNFVNKFVIFVEFRKNLNVMLKFQIFNINEGFIPFKKGSRKLSFNFPFLKERMFLRNF